MVLNTNNLGSKIIFVIELDKRKIMLKVVQVFFSLNILLYVCALKLS